MTYHYLLLLCSLALSICAIAYLAAAESNRRLGLRLKQATGGEREAYALITRLNVENAQVDSMIRLGRAALADAEADAEADVIDPGALDAALEALDALDALLAPRVRPIEPCEFRVVERGRPVRFEDGGGV